MLEALLPGRGATQPCLASPAPQTLDPEPYTQLLSAYSVESGLREKLCVLQQQVSEQTRLNVSIPVKSGVDVAEDLWSRQLEWLRMMQEDVCIDIPRAHMPLPTDGFGMHSPFAAVCSIIVEVYGATKMGA